MSPTEGPPGGASAPQRIIRETPQLQHLVQALSDGHDANFRAIHAVASRIMQAASTGGRRPSSPRSPRPGATALPLWRWVASDGKPPGPADIR